MPTARQHSLPAAVCRARIRRKTRRRRKSSIGGGRQRGFHHTSTTPMVEAASPAIAIGEVFAEQQQRHDSCCRHEETSAGRGAPAASGADRHAADRPSRRVQASASTSMPMRYLGHQQIIISARSVHRVDSKAGTSSSASRSAIPAVTNRLSASSAVPLPSSSARR